MEGTKKSDKILSKTNYKVFVRVDHTERRFKKAEVFCMEYMNLNKYF